MASDPIDQSTFRRLMGQFATGVTVITVKRGEIMHGMTANTFTSLSLDPPLVLFCVGREARMAGLLEGADGFAINILAADQEDVSRHFAGRHFEIGAGVELLQQGPVAPLVPGSLGALSCLIEAMHDGGDHLIVIGRVIALHEQQSGSEKQPLVFFRSRYADLRPHPASQPSADEMWSNDAILIYHDEWSMGDEPPPEEHVRAHIWE